MFGRAITVALGLSSTRVVVGVLPREASLAGLSEQCYNMANTRTDLTTSLTQCATDMSDEFCRIEKWVEIRNELIRTEPTFRDCVNLMPGLVPGLCIPLLDQWISPADMLNINNKFQELCKNEANKVWCEGQKYSAILNKLTLAQRQEMDVCKDVMYGDRISSDACWTDIAKPAMDTLPSLPGPREKEKLGQWYVMSPKSPEHAEAVAQWVACRRLNSKGARSPVCAELLDSALPPLQQGQVCDAACQTNREARAYRTLDAATQARYAQCHELLGQDRSEGYCRPLLVDGDGTSGIQEINDKCGTCKCCVRTAMLQVQNAAPADNKIKFNTCRVFYEGSPEGRCIREATKTALGIHAPGRYGFEAACTAAPRQDICNMNKLVDEFVKMPAAQQKQLTQSCLRP